MVEPYLYSVFSSRVLSLSSTFVSKAPIDALVFPLQCSAVNVISYIHIFSRLLTFLQARVYQHTSVLDVEVP